MAIFYVAEFKLFGYGTAGVAVPAPRAPVFVTQTPLDFTAGEKKSAALNDQTRYVLITADTDCHFLFGVNPTATTSDMPLWAKMYAGFSVERLADMKISVIAAA